MTRKGDRIRLIEMPHDPAPIEAGAEGTVQYIDDIQVWVKWDNGRRLNLIPGVDRWQVIDTPEQIDGLVTNA